MSRVRILILADDPLSRAGLAALLAVEAACQIVGQSATTDAVSTIAVYEPEVLLWDTGWSPAESLERLAEVADDVARPVAVLLPGPEHASAAWSAGARAVLLRSSGAPRVATALLAVTQGLAVLDQGLSLMPASVDTLLPSAHADLLTARELDVLRLVAEGLPNKAIARRLSVSEHTVKFHVNALLGKLGAQSRTEAVVRARRLGLVLL